VLVVNDAFQLRGLITVKDIQKKSDNPNAAKDASTRLVVGAAVGVGAIPSSASRRWSRLAWT
jgi:IMP dehydrogenase